MRSERGRKFSFQPTLATDELSTQGEGFLDRAEVRATLHDLPGALADAASATAAFAAKGNVVGCRAVDDFRRRLG